ncbi:MAG: TetR/AcrR family transcriptional regulator [Clostridia bacterium]|nr:TetR/AcrR family transcriptional regulator [Clostridia bacterium]MBO7288653.1 TetR/AcrR family transcriptional regulator [Clostridia bacterium]
MSKKSERNTKGKIINAAWNLFYEQGYDNTTVEEIIDASQTSKGSFYHYFEGKDALLGSLSYIFDEEYEKLQNSFPSGMKSFEKLLYLNTKLFSMIEDRIDIELLTRLYSTQLVTKGEKHLLDNKRLYYKLLRQIVSEGQKNGELTNEMTANEIVKLYAICERSLIYDWCLCNGEYSLSSYAKKTMPMFLSGIRL